MRGHLDQTAPKFPVRLIATDYRYGPERNLFVKKTIGPKLNVFLA